MLLCHNAVSDVELTQSVVEFTLYGENVNWTTAKSRCGKKMNPKSGKKTGGSGHREQDNHFARTSVSRVFLYEDLFCRIP